MIRSLLSHKRFGRTPNYVIRKPAPADQYLAMTETTLNNFCGGTVKRMYDRSKHLITKPRLSSCSAKKHVPSFLAFNGDPS